VIRRAAPIVPAARRSPLAFDALERDDLSFESSSRSSLLLDDDLSENRYPLFGIML
jgi:hypothetical protein